jgi:hypothetical protein
MYDSKQHFDRSYVAFNPEHDVLGSIERGIENWEEVFRRRLRRIIGLQNIESDLRGHVPTAVRHTSTDVGSYLREEWSLKVEPTVALPLYVLRPKFTKGLVPLVLTPHGHNEPHIYAGMFHNEAERKHMVEGDHDIAVQAVSEGYMAVVPTARGFGATRTDRDREDNRLQSCRTQLMHGLLAGRTPIGERVWDMKCLLDWAIENLEIDPSRIAVTGNSGGGTTTLFSAACDCRISIAMPGCYFSTFKDSIGAIHHCDCNYVPGILRLGEMYDVAGLIAPRPFNAIAGRYDKIFPIESVEYAYERLKQIYDLCGVGSECQLYVGEGGHRYYKEGAWGFLAKYFK